ncbi:MAG: dehydro coenzyme reductase / coenzyme F420-0:L-glutamate ligase / coenzyme [Frankiales bacterium]|jgi:coenzyme F420-0:L-glutamate ligase/coenzyme F420-1:gamma-L-glutamate ligase|nr:dehydro coenzyme reductase / coenzyme F420-0:L-glutamate ligase / coenzyme [Frankiales bacterium]
MTELRVWGVAGLPEVRPGDDLAACIVAAEPDLRDGDVVVVTSKVVSKAEGRIVTGERESAIDGETVRVVARRGDTRIVETRHGLILAAAGVDASNVEPGMVALLPLDPDASAHRIRAGIRKAIDVDVAVLITDTVGRPWRLGLTDIAIGAAGIAVLDDHRGQRDAHGNTLEMTVTAIGDEAAAAAELVKGKTSGVPVAVIRGLPFAHNDAGASVMIRPAPDDMFRYGSRDVVPARRSVRRFTDEPIDPAVVRRALEAALTAPAPHHTVPWRFALVETVEATKTLLDAMLTAWIADLRSDGFPDDAITRRTRRGDVLRTAPYIVVPCIEMTGAHDYPDARRATAERDMFLVAAGAGIENMLIALAADGLGSCWVSSTMFCADVTRSALELPATWDPMGAVAIGHAADEPPPRTPRDIDAYVVRR